MSEFLDTWRSGGTGKGAYILQARTATEKPLIVKGASGQTANIFEVQDSTGTSLFAVDQTGNLTIVGSVTLQINQIVTGDMTLSGNLTVVGTSSFTGLATFVSLTSTGNAVFNDVAANHNLTVNNNLAVNGTTYLNNFVSGVSANYGGGQYMTSATVQTTDATQTTITSIGVNANETYAVEVKVVGMETSASSAGRALYHLNGIFYRSGTGNVTQQGNTNSITTTESAAAWDVSYAVDTTNQLIQVKVTGVAGTTINWKAFVKYFKVQ